MKSEDKFKAILASVLGIQFAEVREGLSNDTVKEWDSLKQMNIIVALEEEFNINYDEAESILLNDYKSLLKATLKKLEQ